MAYDPSRREVEQLKKDLGHMPSLQDMLSVGSAETCPARVLRIPENRDLSLGTIPLKNLTVGFIAFVSGRQ